MTATAPNAVHAAATWAPYVGEVNHRRHVGPGHVFGYRVCAWLLDVEQTDAFLAARPWWARGRFGVLHYDRRDYLGPAAKPLGEAVRDQVESEVGFRPVGPVRMLTQLRCFGRVFNPVTFYWCYAADGETLEAVVAEITNTPWGERHAYALDARGRSGRALRWRFAKSFHISPFEPMELEHDWRVARPGSRAAVHMRNLDPSGALRFEATLKMQRRPATRRAMAAALLRHPLMPWRIHLAIYWQALRLWRKRATFHTHPRKSTPHEPSHAN